MGLFDSMKQKLNIGGAKVEIMAPGAVSKGQTFTLQAKVVGGKLDQKITAVKARFEMVTQQMRRGMQRSTGPDMETSTIVLFKTEQPGFDLKAGETKELTFQMQASAPAEMADQGGIMGGLAKLNKMATRGSESYQVVVEAEIEGSKDTSKRLNVAVQ
jgi:hypothetical protein